MKKLRPLLSIFFIKLAEISVFFKDYSQQSGTVHQSPDNTGSTVNKPETVSHTLAAIVTAHRLFILDVMDDGEEAAFGRVRKFEDSNC
jgi:hypothetical protein